MSAKTLGLPDDLLAYVVANGSTPDDVVRDLIEETRTTLPGRSDMQIAPEQAAFLTMILVSRMTARHRPADADQVLLRLHAPERLGLSRDRLEDRQRPS